jgi:putative transposase
MVKENTELIRTRKYKLKLNSLQKNLLQKHWNNYRYTYNKTISLLNNENVNNRIPDCIKHLVNSDTKIEKASITTYYSKFDLRDMIVSTECNSRIPWILETGSNIRACAVFQAYSAYKTCLSNIKNGNIKFFNLKYKIKKSKSWTMNVDRSNITRYPDGISLYSESGIMRTNENFDITMDCKIHYDGLNYFILAPYSIKDVKINKYNSKDCSLDPGIRKFQSVYSESECIFIGEKASQRIYSLLLILDKTKCKKTEIKIRRKIKNLQTELHNKTSRYLCENYNNIIIPRLSKQNDIIKIKNRKLNKKSVRQMVVLGHSIFLEKLKTKASEYANVQVNEITEEYTSQVCPCCNKCTKTSNEMFKCNYCNLEMDRDILGSRNILLKYYNLLKIQKC